MKLRYASTCSAAAYGSSACASAPSCACALNRTDVAAAMSVLFAFLAILTAFPVAIPALLPAAVLLRGAQRRKNTVD